MPATLNAKLTVTAAAPTVTPRTVRLDFADGKFLIFTDAVAQDVGSYIGPFVKQRCLRAVGAGNGDYRDHFVVFFRPDVDGSSEEVVVEFGSLIKFGAAGVTPVPASGIAPSHLGIPPMTAVSKTGGGTSAQAGNLYIAITYATAAGEGLASGVGGVVATLAAGDRPTVASPPAVANALGYHVYAIVWGVTPGNLYVRQTTAPVPFGQSWTAPATGLLTTGPNIPITPAWDAYVATISGGTLTAPVTVPVPVHEFGTRWRWRSAPRPLVRGYSDLIAMKAILPLDSKFRGGAALPAVRKWAGPGDSAGLMVGMGGEGDRPEIGMTTDAQAAWLLTGDAGCLTTMMAQAEAAGSMSIWNRDASTGAIVDAGAAPYVAYNPPDARYLIPRPTAYPVRGANHFAMDAAHLPAVAYVPYLLTDDPFLLESHHALAMFGVMEANYRRNIEKLPRLCNTGQPRGLAWSWRDIFRAILATPPATPSWLLSQAQWRAFIPDQVSFCNKYLNASASPCTTLFKFFPFTGNTQAFMQDYLTLVIGWIKYTGMFPQMDPIVQYAATPRLVMGDPTDAAGFDHRYQMFYYGPVSDALLGAKATGSNALYDIAPSPNTPTSWKDLLTGLCAWAAVNPSMTGFVQPANLAADAVNPCQTLYLPMVRAGYAALAQAGLSGAQANHDWLAGKLFTSGKSVYGAAWKWAVAPPQ
jgi:hypothetical protein